MKAEQDEEEVYFGKDGHLANYIVGGTVMKDEHTHLAHDPMQITFSSRGLFELPLFRVSHFLCRRETRSRWLLKVS